MKRSKVFLAFTGAVLVIAGVASAKNSKWTRRRHGFFTSTRNRCTQVSQTVGVTKNVSQANVLHTIPASGFYTVWTKSSVTPCVGNKLYTAPPN